MSFVEKHAKPIDAKEVAQGFLNYLNDPDIVPMVSNTDRLLVAKVRGTLTGIVQGQITLGDKSLDEPLQALLVRLSEPFDHAPYEEARHFTKPRGGVLSTLRGASHHEHPSPRDISETKTEPGDGSLSNYTLTDSAWKRFGGVYREKPRVLDEQGVTVLYTKINSLIGAAETLYAAGICVENNPLASKQRSQSPV